MSCKKIYYYEITATLEEEFDSVEKATESNIMRQTKQLLKR